jgi:hypothetical protein
MTVIPIDTNKNTIWIFGESHSALIRKEFDWCRNYILWKGYEPNTFGEIISKKLNFNLQNLAIHGGDNYSIFESFCKNINNIKDGDWLIFGWASLCRYRLGTENKHWASIAPMDTNKYILEKLKYVTQDVLDSISLNRSNVQSLLVNEVEIWMNLIKKVMYNTNIVFWTPSLDEFINTEDKHIGVEKYNIEQIMEETNQVIYDGHYSENGHVDLANIIMNKFL